MLDSFKVAAAEQVGIHLEALTPARRHYHQSGSIYIQGTRKRSYILRYYQLESAVDGTFRKRRKAIHLGLVKDVGNKRQARLLADQKLRSINLGKIRVQSNRTLADFAEIEWTPTILPTLKFSTQRQYKFILKTHLLPELGRIGLCDLRREDLQTFLTRKTQTGLSWETVAHFRNVLSTILSAAVEWGYLSENVARLTKLPRRPPRKPRPFLTIEQVTSLLATINVPARTIVQLLVTTGVRIGEILALRWKNVDLENGILKIREAVYDGHFGTPKTASSIADLPLGPEAIGALTKHLKRMKEKSDPDKLVFANRKGGPLNAKNMLRRVLHPACDRAGIARIGWHGLRHSHATLLAAQGESPKLIQSQLRHSSVYLALQLYTHQIPETQRGAVERLEKNLLASA